MSDQAHEQCSTSAKMGGILATSAASFRWKVANSVFLNRLKLGHSGYSLPDNVAVLPTLTEDDGKDNDDGTESCLKSGPTILLF